MLSSVEEIVLLQLAGRDRPREFSEASNVVLAGAVMMDLASQKRIDCDLNRLFVDDPQSTGEESSIMLYPFSWRPPRLPGSVP